MIEKKKKINYVDNQKFYDEIVKYQEKCREAVSLGKEEPRITNYLGECIQKMSEKISYMPRFINYSFREEMVSDAIENCFHGSTKILTIEYGPIEFEKIVGKTVTIKSRDGVWRPAIVKKYGKKMLYEYGFGSRNKSIKNILQKVISTKDHRWFLQARLSDTGMFIWNKEIVTDLRVGDMLETIKTMPEKDKNAIVHGLIFGDGSVNKRTIYENGSIIRQGTDWAFMRVCKQDRVKDEIITLLDSLGYRKTYPVSAHGDPIYYFGHFPFCKDVPFTFDPSYIAGFIYGWWLADGTKIDKAKSKIINTSNKEAAEWLLENAAYGGYHVSSYRIMNDNVGRYLNGKALYVITLKEDDSYKPRVKYIKEYGIDETYCLEEPVTHGFVLANGLLTGNCIMYFHDFNITKGQNPFAYFTQIIYYAFLRRIGKEERDRYTKYKYFQETIVNTGEADNLLDADDNNIAPGKMYDNINDFMAKFEAKEAEKKRKRKELKSLQKFVIEDENEEPEFASASGDIDIELVG